VVFEYNVYRPCTLQPKFLFWEYLFRIFGIVSLQCTHQLDRKACEQRKYDQNIFMVHILCTLLTDHENFETNRMYNIFSGICTKELNYCVISSGKKVLHFS
jgi:hypothetical protein